MQIIITKHARDKIKERFYVEDFKEAVSLGIKAFYSKEKITDICYIRKYEREKNEALKNNKNIVYKFYKEFVFIFDISEEEGKARLITVYDPHLIKWL